MPIRLRRILLARLSLALSLVLLLSLVVWPVSAAGAARLYVSPSSKTVSVGQSFSLDLRVDSGDESMTAVEANGTYDDAKLRLTSIDTSGSPFDMEAEKSFGDGSFSIVRVALNNTKGDVLLARLNFEALATGQSDVDLNDDSQLSDPNGKFFNLERDSSSVSVNQSSPGPTASSNPTPTGHNMTVTPIYTGYSIVTFRVTTSRTSSAAIEYGLSADDLEFNAQSSAKSATLHTLSFNEALTRPATTYHYRVTSRSTSGSIATSPVGQVTTQGLSVNLQIVDANEQPVKAGVRVLGAETKQDTSDNGQLTLTNLTDGLHTLKIDTGWRDSEHNIDLNRDIITNVAKSTQGVTTIEQEVVPPSVVVQLDYVPFTFTAANVARYGIYVLIGLVLLLALIRGGVVIFYRRKAVRRIENQAPAQIFQPSEPPPGDEQRR